MAAVRGSRRKSGTRPVLRAPAAPLTTETQPADELTDRGSSESRRERHRREIFDRLVEAARQLMFSRPFDDARVQDITDLADVGKGTFFNFFSTKELVIPEIARERARQLQQSVAQVKAGQLSSREALNHFINGGLAQKLSPADWHNYYGSFLRSMAHDERIRVSLSEVLREQEQVVRDLVALGQESGEFRNDRDPSDLAIYLLRAFLGLQLIAWVHGVGLNPDELDANARLTFELLLCPASPSTKPARIGRSAVPSPQGPKPAHTGRKRRSREGSR
jgi:AcrR family transcriptional regulator